MVLPNARKRYVTTLGMDDYKVSRLANSGMSIGMPLELQPGINW